jgi:RNA polymerase sigma factor (sigma-70 family)
MTSLPETRYTLLARLADTGDAAAWHEFAEIYEPAVVRFAKRRGLQESDACDVAQETLAAVAKSLARWSERSGQSSSSRQGTSFRAWLYAVARNIAVNRLQRGRNHRGAGGNLEESFANIAASPTLAAAFDREYRLAAITWAGQHVQREVTAETWQAFWLTAIEGIPIPQAARQLGMQVGNIYAARSRVIARLKNRIDSLDENERDALREQVEMEMHKQAAAADLGDLDLPGSPSEERRS